MTSQNAENKTSLTTKYPEEVERILNKISRSLNLPEGHNLIEEIKQSQEKVANGELTQFKLNNLKQRIDAINQCVLDGLNQWDRQQLIFNSGLSPKLRRVLVVIEHYAGSDGVCFRSQEYIAFDIGVSERQLRRCLSELTELAILDSTRIGKCCNNRTSLNWSKVIGRLRPITDRTPVSGHSESDRTSMSDVIGHPCPVGQDTSVRSNSNTPNNIPLTTHIISFPLRSGEEWKLSKEKLSELKQSFPSLDVEQQIRCARQWCIDNPTKRKTASGMPKFLSNWLTRQFSAKDQQRNSNGQKQRAGRAEAKPGKYSKPKRTKITA